MKNSLVVTKKQRILRECRDYLMIFLGIFMYSVGWTVFLLPNTITTGGVPGIASVVFWGTGINVQYTYFVVNAMLLIAALLTLGWRFSVKTIFAVFAMTLILPVLQHVTEGLNMLHDQPFMACVIGASFTGGGIGVAFLGNGSTGGTDIVAAIINKYRDISLGRVILMTDMFIILSSYLVLHDWEKVVYGFATLYISTFVLDQVVNGARSSVQFFIVSKDYELIAKRINTVLHRGVTLVDGVGSFTGKDVKLMFVLAKKRESNLIFRLIKDIDPKAFVSQSAVIGVFGEGFDRIR